MKGILIVKNARGISVLDLWPYNCIEVIKHNDNSSNIYISGKDIQPKTFTWVEENTSDFDKLKDMIEHLVTSDHGDNIPVIKLERIPDDTSQEDE